MDIEVGEYVRINNDSRNCIGIGKVIKTIKNTKGNISKDKVCSLIQKIDNLKVGVEYGI